MPTPSRGEISGFDRTVTVVGAVIPFASSAQLRKFFKGATDKAGDALDAAGLGGRKAGCTGEVSNAIRATRKFCFAPETPVQTPDGLRRIDEIQVGDLVRAFDFDAGQWVDRPVEATHHNVYDGPVVSVTTEDDTIRCTVYHPFWVISGRDLTERPFPRNLQEGESEGKSLAGRWVNSHDLRPGDVLFTHDHREIVIQKIEQEYNPEFDICNLTVATNHSFTVGEANVLVHNTSECAKNIVDHALDDRSRSLGKSREELYELVDSVIEGDFKRSVLGSGGRQAFAKDGFIIIRDQHGGGTIFRPRSTDKYLDSFLQNEFDL